jgi:putative alpha-1,2-mannosidase
MSLLDACRTVHRLRTLTWPEVQQHLAGSPARTADQSGYPPRPPLNQDHTQTMFDDPADSVLDETWLEGLEGWDTSDGLRAAKRWANGDDHGGYGPRLGHRQGRDRPCDIWGQD